MDAILSTVGTIVVECGKCLCVSVWMNVNNFYKFNSNVDDLENQMRRLLGLKKQIQDELDLEEVDGKIRTRQVIMWLQKIEEMEESVASTRAEITTNKEKLYGCRTKPSLRYKLSKQVVEKLNQVKQVLNEGLPPQPLVMVDLRLKAVEERPGPSITSQDTASKNLQRVMNELEKDSVRVIGVWGMGGVGKTALVTSMNNKLSNGDAKAFGLVVWVTVSKDANIKQMQLRVAERLRLSTSGTESTDGLATRIAARLMKEHKFLLILDDVWERLDLDKVGIPRPEVHGGYKVLLTTRFRDVCDEMAADVKLQVIPLSEDEAWALFAQTARDVVNSADVKPLATVVAKECAGLPLAILVVGGAMKGKTNIESWKDALKALQTSNPPPQIPGVKGNVYSSLKFSYDSLDSKDIRACFLYCCLYPEDYDIPIKQLLRCWLAEGYLDEWEDHEDAYAFGRMMIERLKDSCLLEGNNNYFVKMHDVVRDFGIWMASNSEDGCSRSLVRSGIGLKEITGVERWGSYQRISYMRNEIQMLPDCANSQCSQVSSLLFGWNFMIENIPAGFFLGFQALRVLNLSWSGIRSLPGTEYLGELRTLFMSNCYNMKEFPSLRGLDRLQVLDLSGTLYSVKQSEGTFRRDLRQCKHLVELYVCFSEGVLPHFNSEEDTILFRRLRRSEISISGRQSCRHSMDPDKGLGLYIDFLETLTEPILFLVRQATSLHFGNVAAMVIWRCLKVGVLDCLKSLNVYIMEDGTDSIDMMEDMSHDGRVLLPSLESVSLSGVPRRMIDELFCLCGDNVRRISAYRCDDMTRLIHLSLLHKLERLEKIGVGHCFNVVEIIEDEEDNCTTPGNAFPNLRSIRLSNLPKLNSICKQVMSWPHIHLIEVIYCPALKNLPLSCQHANTIEYIRGEREWWDELQWPDDATKSSLQHKFQILSR